MKCPRCPDRVLDERVREGVTVDTCPECRGIWLDRGELERLVSKLSRDYESEMERYPRPEPSPAPPDRRPKRPDESWDDDDFKRYRDSHGDPRAGSGYPPRKRGFLHTLGELFD
jgi:Zn-finger nucleic acid-binding protein